MRPLVLSFRCGFPARFLHNFAPNALQTRFTRSAELTTGRFAGGAWTDRKSNALISRSNATLKTSHMKTKTYLLVLVVCLTGAWLCSHQAKAGTLSGTLSTAPAAVNLTAEGTLDWAHWGLAIKSDFDHKAGGASQISDVTTVGTVEQFPDALTGFSWSDGTPTASAAICIITVCTP